MDKKPEITSRIDSVDLLKSIAIYLVIIYHYNGIPVNFIADNNEWIYFNYFIKTLFSPCVPLFFFVNGLLLLRKKTIDLRAHIYKIVRIMVLTTVWSALTIVAISLIRGDTLSIYLKDLWVLRYGWNDHLWFLKALVVIYIFYPLIHIAYREQRKIFYFFFACVMLFTFGNIFTGDLATVVSFFTGADSDSNLRINYWAGYNPFKDPQAYAMGYFMLGGIAYHYQNIFNTRKFKIIAVITLLLSTAFLFLLGIIESLRIHAVWDTVWEGYNTVFTLLNVVAIFILSLNYRSQGKTGQLIILTGKNSLGIYLIHKITIVCFNLLFSQSGWPATMLLNIVYAGVILLCSLVLVIVLQKIPLVKYLFLIK